MSWLLDASVEQPALWRVVHDLEAQGLRVTGREEREAVIPADNGPEGGRVAVVQQEAHDRGVAESRRCAQAPPYGVESPVAST